MSDNELFILLMGSTEYDNILPFVKSASESRVVFDVQCVIIQHFVPYCVWLYHV